MSTDDERDLPEVLTHDPSFESLLRYLKDTRRFDFTGYKRASLMRRVRRRMVAVGAAGFDEYLDRLQVDPDEFTALFNTVLINVTGFFRDAEVWDLLREEVLPDLLRRRPTGVLRFWSAGCASGEEAYGLAMLLVELLGPDEFRARVKLYATDVGEDALAEARAAVYPQRRLSGLSQERIDRYFEPAPGTPDRYAVRKDLRRSVIFGRNDLVQDAPIGRIDLLLCRNTLMYFNAEQQSGILGRLHFALDPEGRLLLGKAEMILGSDALFEPVDLKRRLFRKVAAEPVRDTGAAVRRPVVDRSADHGLADLRAATLTHSPVAVVVVSGGRLALVNERAESLLGVGLRDVSRPFQDLELSYRPVELRSSVEQVEQQRLPLWIRDVRWERQGREPVVLDLQLVPVAPPGSPAGGVAVFFNDVTRYHAMRDELERANRQVETAYEELQSTNEELETTNEELQSTVEELETTNEELQSTNEELETMNEELQSMNDELQHSNDALRGRSAEIEGLNELLETILTSLRGGVAVVDADLQVLLWNRQSEDLWGIRADEALGRHLYNLDIGLPLEPLRPVLLSLLGDSDGGPPEGEVVFLEAHNRRGRGIRVRVTVNPLLTGQGSVRGAVLVADDVTAEQPA